MGLSVRLCVCTVSLSAIDGFIGTCVHVLSVLSAVGSNLLVTNNNNMKSTKVQTLGAI